MIVFRTYRVHIPAGVYTCRNGANSRLSLQLKAFVENSRLIRGGCFLLHAEKISSFRPQAVYPMFFSLSVTACTAWCTALSKPSFCKVITPSMVLPPGEQT